MSLFSTAIGRGLFSARPTDNAAGTTGRLYYATDYGILYRDNGTSWDAMLDITSLTADGSPDGANDYVLSYDATAGYLKKVLMDNLPGAGGATPAVVQLSDNLLASPAANVDITSISASYRHLKLIVQARCTGAVAAASLNMIFNNDSGANYYRQQLSASGTTVSGVQATGLTAIDIGALPGASATANLAAVYEVIIPNYAQTTFVKAIRISQGDWRDLSTSFYLIEISALWNSTAAINRITLTPASGNFDTGTIVSLYGIN